MITAPKLFDLTDKVVAITGAAGFLGAIHASAVLEANGSVVLLDKDPEQLAEVSRSLRSTFGEGKVIAICMDVTEGQAIRDGHRRATRAAGHIDVLVNNAAVNPSVGIGGSPALNDRFETFPLERWNEEISVGLTGAFLCSQVFGAAMALQGFGVIINISSDLGLISPDQRLYELPGVAADFQPVKPVSYSVVKTGIHGLTRYLATYWTHNNVRVNTVSFGGVLNGQPSIFLARVNDRIPLGRLARADEYKGCIVFLCSDASSYMNGANLVVDGGRTVW